ncbi:MAG: glycosyltransferase family 4 protein [Candidatus Magasanikbacteria bacterium]|jgi:glycosyltransferase involved in cell wall biosynthesis|nr:glycosyltransferase family 4 protein [Candidatus Magasanikbacteria bacterium]
MRVAIDMRPLCDAQRTGVGELTAGMVQALLTHAPHHEYVFFTAGKKRPEDLPGDVQHVHMPMPSKVLRLLCAMKLAPNIDEYIAKKTGKMVDVFFSPNIGFTSVSDACKFVLTMHDLSFEVLKETFSWRRRHWHKAVQPKKQCQRANAIVVPSKHTKIDITSLYGIATEKIMVVQPGLTVPKETDSFEIIAKTYALPERYIFCLGTIEPRKNIDALLDAYAQLRKHSGNGFSLVIAGADGWKHDTIKKRMASESGVQYIGYVKSAHKRSLFANARLCVYPSRYEGFGFPVLEAMEAGVPVITSSRTSLPEVGGDAVFYVDTMNTAALAEAMREILTTPALQQQLIEKGKKRAAQFSWKKAAEQIESLIISL